MPPSSHTTAITPVSPAASGRSAGAVEGASGGPSTDAAETTSHAASGAVSSASARPNAVSATSPGTLTCDLFCAVVDNFGDAGVCWRLARQLANERGWRVRLLIDQPEVLGAMLPTLPPFWSAPTRADAPHVDGVRIDTWVALAHTPPAGHVADVVIEAFACELPPAYLAAMALRPTPPVWINFDYLSAEDWVADFHLLPSPHPRLPLLKTFFFPGLAQGTGGLLRENDLSAQRDAFLADGAAQQNLLNKLGVAAMPAVGTTRITLFAYENPAITPLLQQWAAGAHPIALFVPAGRISPQVATFFGKDAWQPGTHARKGNLAVHAVPFMSQTDYDRLLWLADMNFVRGEDSFVRAQWAQRPFAWHIYPQPDDAHLDKLDAALDHYTAALPAPTQAAVRRFWHAWNTASADSVIDWPDFWQHAEPIAAHGRQWADTLRQLGSLSENLADFVESRLK